MGFIAERIKYLITDELGIDFDIVVPSARIVEDLGCDSLQCIELTSLMEDEFNISIPDEDVENIQTVYDLTEYVIWRSDVRDFPTDIYGKVHLPNVYNLPVNMNTDTQVAELCFFKTMEWVSRYYDANINSGASLTYYYQTYQPTKNLAYQLAHGFEGNVDEYYAVISHYFNSTVMDLSQIQPSQYYSAYRSIISVDRTPVLAYFNSANNIQHAVMITGFNDNDSTLQYYDPQSGQYGSKPASDFQAPVAVSGVK